MTGRRWLTVALLAGVAYALIGITVALPQSHVRFWRLAAWVVSAIIFTAHIGYERLSLHHSVRVSATHVALAAALGAFGLALGANVHSLLIGSAQHRGLLLLSLVVWPLITAIPAFVVGLALSFAMQRR